MYLNCHSFHSLRYGTIPLDDLIEKQFVRALPLWRLTDINTVTGIYFIIECKGIAKPWESIFVIIMNLDTSVCQKCKRLAEMNRF
jgi:DNA polymerase-3 subunit alpha/error-prone DNA polymerase